VIATPTAATSPVRAPGQPGVRQWVADADDAYLQSISDTLLDCTSYFANKVDGFLSLSGGRVGGSHMNPQFGPPKADGSPPDPRPSAMGAGALPACDFSHIYTTGEYEITDLQDTSAWAEKLGCKPRIREKDIVDEVAGYVYDNNRAGYKVWGMKARPGTATEYLYKGCKDGRLVADVVRLDKGHTEGLEPKVTETIVKLMVSVPGGKVAKGG